MALMPGIDTALVIRTGLAEGKRQAALASVGVVLGCLTWGLTVALGLAALLQASTAALDILRFAGAAYLSWLGLALLAASCRSLDPEAVRDEPRQRAGSLRRGYATNVLNPKAGIFYVSFLPQFSHPGVPAFSFTLLLAAIHALISLAWFGVLTYATHRVAGMLRKPGVMLWLDRVTGAAFIWFGAALALEQVATSGAT